MSWYPYTDPGGPSLSSVCHYDPCISSAIGILFKLATNMLFHIIFSFQVLLGAYVRYKLVLCSSPGDLSKHSRRLNVAGFVLSVMAAVGMSVVATVRVSSAFKDSIVSMLASNSKSIHG